MNENNIYDGIWYPYYSGQLWDKEARICHYWYESAVCGYYWNEPDFKILPPLEVIV